MKEILCKALFCALKFFLYFILLLTFNIELGTFNRLYAGVPNIVNYQGRYREYGQPITGSRTMSFTVYDASTGGSQLWTSGAQTVKVTNGIFSVQFNPLVDLRALSTGVLYLEMDVTPVGGGSTKALMPRERLTSNWYALHAMSAEDIEKSSGQNIHFAIGASTYMVINTSGIEIESGGIKFPDGSYMVSAGSGSAVAISNTGDVIINADANNHGTGKISVVTGNTERMAIANNGSVTISSSVAIAGDLTVTGTSNLMPVGTILAYGAATAPNGWLLCDGSDVSITTYQRLYNVIGTQFGNGNHTTTFNVPDLRGIFLRGWNNGKSSGMYDPDSASRTQMGQGESNKGGGNAGDLIGSIQTDTFQGHAHVINKSPKSPGGLFSNGGSDSNFSVSNTVAADVASGPLTALSPVDDGSHGTPRISYETRPINAYVNYIIKY